jgi:7-cyano-7-deazaguanine synthase in queuosine biosynthesis
MKTVFIKSSLQQAIPGEYSSGLVLGPIYNKARCGFRHTLDNLLCRPRKPNRIVQSFTTVALAAYMADKGYQRSQADDSWTRKLTLNVPMDQDFSQAIPILSDGLQFLSGDLWQIKTRFEKVSVGARSYYEDQFSPDAVCLFSGGTDSLTGAINLLEDGKSIIAISHFESGSDAGIQNNLVKRLRTKYGSKHIRHLSIRVCSSVSMEPSTRSRSFLFIALGLMAASAYSDEVPVYIPENGFVGINIPLTGSRQGSYSTRTTHPAFLSTVRAGLKAVGIQHSINNPLSYLSKGEVLRSCKNLALLRQLLPLTVSCAKAGWVRWKGRSPGTNCGFCYPCLIRRAALHSIHEDDPSDYLYDAIGSHKILKADKQGSDLRSLLQAVHKYENSKRSLFFEILKTGSTSTVDNPSGLVHPIKAGIQEVLSLVSDKGCHEVKRYTSL